MDLQSRYKRSPFLLLTNPGIRTTQVLHPLNFRIKTSHHEKLMTRPHLKLAKSQMSGFPQDLFDTIAGAVDAIGRAIESIILSVANLVSEILEAVRLTLQSIDWKQIGENLGKIFRGIGHILVQLNPLRILKYLPLTAQLFKDLDDFTGGFLGTVTNVIDLPARGLRGDAITKKDWIEVAIVAITAASIWFGGAAAAGGLVGGWVGNEACKSIGNNQERQNCQTLFIVAGTITGGSAALANGIQATSWSQLTTEQAARYAGMTFQDIMTDTVMTELQRRAVTEITREAVKACQTGNWVGDRECAIIGMIAKDYVNSPDDMEWEEFLAKELAVIGVALLAEQWFPPGSKEREAVRRQLMFENYLLDPLPEVAEPPPPKMNAALAALTLAAGAGFLMLNLA